MTLESNNPPLSNGTSSVAAKPVADSPLKPPSQWRPEYIDPIITSTLESLSSLRAAHARNPTATPTALLESMRPPTGNGYQTGRLATPALPLGPHAPDLSRPSDARMLAAFLLQAICLGISGFGLLARSKAKARERAELAHMRDMQARGELNQRDHECSAGARDVQALNLLLSSYAEAILAQHFGLTRLARSLLSPAEWVEDSVAIEQLLRHADQAHHPVDHLSSASVLGFANHSQISSNNVQSKVTLTRQRLNLWAWDAYSRLAPASTPENLRDNMLRTFVRLSIDNGPLLPPSALTRIFTGMGPRLTLLDRDRDAALLDALCRHAIAAKRINLLPFLLAPSSPLSPVARFSLGVRLLESFANEPEIWSQQRDVVLPRVAYLLADIVEEVPVDVGLVEEAVTLLTERIQHSTSTEQNVARLLVAAIGSTDLIKRSSPDFVPRLLRHFVDSRNPRLAKRVLFAIPPFLRTIEHYNPVLRSHRAATSQKVWDDLLQRSKTTPRLRPTPESFSCRLTCHGHKDNLDLAAAYKDMSLANWLGIERTTKLWNKLLKVVVKVGTDGALARQVAKMRNSGVEMDSATVSILAARKLHGRRRRYACGEVDVEREAAGSHEPSIAAVQPSIHSSAPSLGLVQPDPGQERVPEVLRHRRTHLVGRKQVEAFRRDLDRVDHQRRHWRIQQQRRALYFAQRLELPPADQSTATALPASPAAAAAAAAASMETASSANGEPAPERQSLSFDSPTATPSVPQTDDNKPISSERPHDDEFDFLHTLALQTLTRWTREVSAPVVVRLAHETLGVDVAHALPRPASPPPVSPPRRVDQSSSDRRRRRCRHRRQRQSSSMGPAVEDEVVEQMREFHGRREPTYRLLIKALRNRGAVDAARELKSEYLVEKARWREQERRRREEGQAGVGGSRE